MIDNEYFYREKCYVYIIYDETFDNIVDDGYIGISKNPEKRLKAHIKNAKNSYYRINNQFRKSLLNNTFKFKILLEDTRIGCLYFEKILRPKGNMGWNIIEGGENGLINTKRKVQSIREKVGEKAYIKYFSLKRDYDNNFIDEWKDEGGLENFSIWYNSLLIDKNQSLVLIDSSSLIGPDNFVIGDKNKLKTYLNKNKKYSGFFDSSLTLNQWSHFLNLKPNTISCRLRRVGSFDSAILKNVEIKNE